MTILDYAVLLVYLLGITAVGAFAFTSQSGLKDYFLGGRSIPWLASTATLIAAGISAITFVGMPGLAFEKDIGALQMYLGMPFAAILAAALVVPFFYRQDIISAYEFLEKRFDSKTRLLASVVYQILYVFILGTVIAAPAKVLSEFSGMSYVWAAVIVCAFTSFYTVIGGMKAVVWTDVIQLFLMLGGPLLALGILIFKMEGGVNQVLEIAAQNNKLRLFDTSFSLETEVTVWAAFTGLAIYHFSSLVVGQGNVQKYLTAKSVSQAQRAVVWHGFGLLAIWTLFFLIGVALYAFHAAHPDRLPATADADRVFVRFVINELPAGIRGAVLSAVFAAGMSTISAMLNSLSSMTVVDIVQRFFPQKLHGREIPVARALTFAWSVASLITAIIVVRWGGVVKAGLQIGNFFSGPLLAVFMLGMFTRRSNAPGVFAGAIIGLMIVAFVAQFTRVSWAWHCMIGTIAAAVSGYGLSLFFPEPSDRQVEHCSLSATSGRNA